MDFEILNQKLKVFNDMINTNHKDKTKAEITLLKSLKISEEVGEFHNEVLGSLGFTRAGKEHSRENLEEEFADVIISTIITAIELDIDIEKVLGQKLEKIFNRFGL